jgi:hypothetical protein
VKSGDWVPFRREKSGNLKVVIDSEELKEMIEKEVQR